MGKRLQQFSKRYENTIKWWQGAYLFLTLPPEKNCSTIGMYHRFWCIARGSTNGSCAQDPTEFHALRKPRTSPRPQECSSCSVRERKTVVSRHPGEHTTQVGRNAVVPFWSRSAWFLGGSSCQLAQRFWTHLRHRRRRSWRFFKG